MKYKLNKETPKEAATNRTFGNEMKCIKVYCCTKKTIVGESD